MAHWDRRELNKLVAESPEEYKKRFPEPFSAMIPEDASSENKLATEAYVNEHGGGGSGSDPEAVKYTEQTLTVEQKAQALANIGGASAESVTTETARATAAEEDIMDAMDGTNVEVVTALPTASASTVGKFYYVGPDGNGEYARYRGIESGGSYSFLPVGSTQIDLSTYATTSEVSQLQQKVDELATGKYYGTFTSSSLLPEGTIPGFAYVGTENPFEIYTFDGTSWSDSGATMDGSDIPSLNPFKGLYSSLALLETAYPNPQLGDYAYVKNSGTPATANIYNEVGGEWADTHIVVSITDMESVFPLFAKLSLISTLEKVAWIDANGQTYLNDLRTALLGNIELVSISASFNPGTNVILDTMSLDNLKDYLTVTATFSDGTQEVVSGYQLSGVLTAGTNTITVTYLDETTTFTVTVKHNYAGSLDTWTLHPASGVAEYVNGYIRMKCVTSSMQSGFSVWCADAAKTTWGDVNGKKLKFRVRVNTISTDIGAFTIGIYNSSSPSSLGNTYSRRRGAGTWELAGDGFYEVEQTMDLNDFTVGTYSPTNSSAFGLNCYARALNDYIEIYDVQIFEVE